MIKFSYISMKGCNIVSASKKDIRQDWIETIRALDNDELAKRCFETEEWREEYLELCFEEFERRRKSGAYNVEEDTAQAAKPEIEAQELTNRILEEKISQYSDDELIAQFRETKLLLELYSKEIAKRKLGFVGDAPTLVISEPLVNEILPNVPIDLDFNIINMLKEQISNLTEEDVLKSKEGAEAILKNPTSSENERIIAKWILNLLEERDNAATEWILSYFDENQ